MKKGDVVVCIREFYDNKDIVVKIGVVMRGSSSDSGVEFLESIKGGHSLGGVCREGHCWNITDDCLIKLNYLKGDVLFEK